MEEGAVGDDEGRLYDLSIFYELYEKDAELNVDQKISQACGRIIFPKDKIFPKNLYESLDSLAKSLGVPFEYVSQPLIALTANLMNGSYVVAKAPQYDGDKGHIEPIILNVLTLGAKTTNKSAAYKIFEEELADIEAEDIREAESVFNLENEGVGDDGESSAKRKKKKFDPTLHRRFLKKTTEGGLVKTVTTDHANKNIAIMYEEFYIFSNLVDFSNPKNDFLSIYLESYGASSIRQTTQTRGFEGADKPFIQFVVYAQPAVFVKELAKFPDDPSGAWERMLIVNPKRIIRNLEDCHQTELSSKADVSTVLHLVRDAHRDQGIQYTFDDDAKKFFYEVDRDIKEQMRQNEDDTEFCGMVGKDIQKILRAAPIFAVLRNVAKTTDESYAVVSDMVKDVASEVVDGYVEKATGNISPKIIDHERVDFLNEEIAQAVMREDFISANQLKEERDKLVSGNDESSSSGDPELYSSRYLIRKVDVESALVYVRHCAGISIQLKEGARDLAEMNKRSGIASPHKAPKSRKSNYWAENLDDIDKSFDFVVTHAEKLIKIFDNAKDGEIPMNTVRTKRCFPQASSSKPRGVEVDKALSLYFVKILIHHGVLDKLIENESKVLLPKAEDISPEVEEKFRAIQKKFTAFKPFD